MSYENTSYPMFKPNIGNDLLNCNSSRNISRFKRREKWSRIWLAITAIAFVITTYWVY